MKTNRHRLSLISRRGRWTGHLHDSHPDRRQLRFESLEDRRMLAVFTVTSNADSGAGSLRDAIVQANSMAGADTINFDAGVFSGGSNNLVQLTSGELEITDTLTIDGTALTDNVTIDAQQNSRVLNFSSTTGDLTLNGLTVTGGQSAAGANGGGILFISSGSLTLLDSVVTGNATGGGGEGESGGSGGGIYTLSGNVTLTNSTLSGNSTGAGGGSTGIGGSGGDGGGISTSSGNVTLTNSTLSGNSTGAGGDGDFGNGGFGGGVSTSDGNVTLTNSTLSGNSTGSGGVGFLSGSSGFGGGISTRSGNVTLANSTVSGNSTAEDFGHGGGIYSFSSSLSLTSSTVTGNKTGGEGGGVFVSDRSYNPTFTIENSIVAGNTDNGTAPDLRPDPDSTLTINHSLIGVADGLIITGNVGNQTGTAAAPLDPLLGPLADNGGPTMTHALLPGSPAIDAGSIRVTVPGVFGTGLDANGNLLLDNQDDPHYTLVSQPNSGTFTAAALTEDGFPIPPWVANSSTSRWIGPNTPNAEGPIGEYIYRTQFDLTGFDESTAFLQGNWATDNSASFWINGIDGLATTGAEEFGALQSFTDPSPFVFVAGINVLEFRVTNGGVDDGPTGLRVDDLRVTVEAIAFDQRGNSRNGGPVDIGAFERQTVESTTLVVSTNTDVEDGNYRPGELSLREAISITNANGGDDSIEFNPAIAGQTIDLSGTQLEITDRLTVTGSNFQATKINAGLNSRVLHYSGTSGDLVLENLEILGGEIADRGAGIKFDSNGELTLRSSTVHGNTTTGDNHPGGGIYSDSGSLSLIESTISDNRTIGFGADGGGIFSNSGSVSLIDSTIRNNRTTGYAATGGGVSTSAGDVTITNSTVSGNSTLAQGGGIRTNSGMVSLTNSTVSGNTSGYSGGGIYAYSSGVTLTSSTVSGNRAGESGGGISLDAGGFQITEQLTINNSIIAGNSDDRGSPEFQPPSGGTNQLNLSNSLIGENTGTGLAAAATPDSNGNLIGSAASPIHPHLGPLADNGGPTQTRALLPGSPALNAGSSSEAEDQRGEDRNDGNGVDIGAYEAQIAPSADFDSDGDVDGFDFLAWQRGFGITTGAVRADGNSDDDGDVDRSDLAAWEVSYAQPQTLVAAGGSGSRRAGTVGSAELVDAALALEWLSVEDDNFASPLVATKPPAELDNAIAVPEFLAPIAGAVSVPNIESGEAVEADVQPWLADELLERVFG